ncbi:MAG: hypothetical protein RSC05_08255 [Acinetobacter sp.]
MNILNSLLNCELSIANKTTTKTYFFLSILFSMAFVYLTINLEDKRFVCFFAGLLIFWERFLVFKLNKAKGGK